MSELRVDSVKSKGGGAPNLPKGVTISGITTAVTLGATQIDVSNVNVSGVVTSATLSGDLLSTGTPTLGLGVTINSSGLHITGVATAGIVSATTLYGDGTNITGVGASIAPLFYQPDPYDTGVLLDTGIGITFNQQVKAGSGNVTLSIANAGVAGTVVENFGVGSSVSISENRITINPTADLSAGFAQYFISYPSGCFTNNEGTAYAGTGYTFGTRAYQYELWSWGYSHVGQVGVNNKTYYSSPIQIPGTTWNGSATIGDVSGGATNGAIKTDGTLWVWGYNGNGRLAQNNESPGYSSPIQIPGTTWASYAGGYGSSLATKTDGTLWVWGDTIAGGAGQNNQGVEYSSPVQIPGTTWSTAKGSIHGGNSNFAIKTDGTLWTWGQNEHGSLGQNTRGPSAANGVSSPTQVPGTTWSKIVGTRYQTLALKTNGTLWTWGKNNKGQMGVNDTIQRSSPTQVPGTTWSAVGLYYEGSIALKTDGTLWTWGDNEYGALAQNDRTEKSSPVQVPGTTWSKIASGYRNCFAVKTDGTLWSWGYNQGGSGQLGLNNRTTISSPAQIGSGTDWSDIASSGGTGAVLAFKRV